MSWLADVAQIDPDDITAPAITQQGVLVARSYRSDTVAHGLGDIGIPTLIFSGSDDEVVPVANSRDLARRIARFAAHHLLGRGLREHLSVRVGLRHRTDVVYECLSVVGEPTARSWRSGSRWCEVTGARGRRSFGRPRNGADRTVGAGDHAA